MAAVEKKSKKPRKVGILAGKVVGVSSFNSEDDKTSKDLNYEELRNKAEAAGANVSGIIHKKVFVLIATVGARTSIRINNIERSVLISTVEYDSHFLPFSLLFYSSLLTLLIHIIGASRRTSDTKSKKGY